MQLLPKNLISGFRKRSNESGQALLVVLLVMSVVLTATLSVVSRSVTDIAVTTYEEESLRAFSAAEAGVEQVLLQGIGVSDPGFDLETNTEFTATTQESSVGDQFVYPKGIVAGESATFWQVSHDSSDGRLSCSGPQDTCFEGTTMNICWGDGDPTEVPAIEISLYYDTTNNAIQNPNIFTNVGELKYTYDPDATRRAGNGFDPPSASCSWDTDFAYSADVVLPGACSGNVGCILMTKVKSFYNLGQEPVGINVISVAGNTLPAQGVQIESTGTSGESQRKVNVFQGYPEPPSMFEGAIFSGGGLTK
jgi:type II secretory pathway pseudopilin PulG